MQIINLQFSRFLVITDSEITAIFSY